MSSIKGFIMRYFVFILVAVFAILMIGFANKGLNSKNILDLFLSLFFGISSVAATIYFDNRYRVFEADTEPEEIFSGT